MWYGLNGAMWQGNDGSYFVMQCGDTLVYGTTPNFGDSATYVITSDTCTPPPPIPGCMDDSYLEYNPSATVTDSSCATLKILGCTDSTMFNYNPLANVDNGSCIPFIYGCTKWKKTQTLTVKYMGYIYS